MPEGRLASESEQNRIFMDKAVSESRSAVELATEIMIAHLISHGYRKVDECATIVVANLASAVDVQQHCKQRSSDYILTYSDFYSYYFQDTISTTMYLFVCW